MATPQDIARGLTRLGCPDTTAAAIVGFLADAGLPASRMAAWIEGYTVRRTGPFTARAPSLIADGEADAVLDAAAAYANASPDERFVSFALDGANLEDVRALGATRVRRVLELLLAQLQTPQRVYECVNTTFGGPEEDTLRDCLMDNRLEAVASALEQGGFDAWRHLEGGVIRISSSGPLKFGPPDDDSASGPLKFGPPDDAT